MMAENYKYHRYIVFRNSFGTFSKFLDFRQAEFPSVLRAIDGALDVPNFLRRYAIWVLIVL